MSAPAAPDLVPLPEPLLDRSGIAAVSAQPTSGQTMRLRAEVSEGMIPAFGDYIGNTGKIDVLAISANGQVTTLLPQFDTEEIDTVRQFGGYTFIPSIDPRGSDVASIATDHGGTWKTVEVAVPDRPVAVHLYDVAGDPQTGDWLSAGARGPDTAIVWRSRDEGQTWTEDLAHEADGDGFNRFYEFRRSVGRLVVSTSYGLPAHYVLGNGSWTPADSVTFDAEPDPKAWVIGSQLNVTGWPIRMLPTPAVVWSARLDGQGWVWVCDGETIWRLPPPD